MKKLLVALAAVLCIISAAAARISAEPSFSEGGYHVVAQGDCTSVKADYNEVDDPAVNEILADPTVEKLAKAVKIPSPSSHKVTLATKFFEVTNTCQADGGAVSFSVESSKIVSGAEVGVAHYSTARKVWEYVKASEVDTANHIATFNLADGSPVILVVSVAKSGSSATTGVVNTGTK